MLYTDEVVQCISWQELCSLLAIGFMQAIQTHHCNHTVASTQSGVDVVYTYTSELQKQRVDYLLSVQQHVLSRTFAQQFQCCSVQGERFRDTCLLLEVASVQDLV